jgi:hypothetical protein
VSRTSLIVGATTLVCAACLIWLQGEFTSSDHRKAERLVRLYRVDHRDETFEQFLARSHGGNHGQWGTDISDGCRGVVRVTWAASDHPDTVYRWDVEIPTQEIYAVVDSPGGERLLQEFNGPAAPLPPLDLPPVPPPGAPAPPASRAAP